MFKLVSLLSYKYQHIDLYTIVAVGQKILTLCTLLSHSWTQGVFGINIATLEVAEELSNKWLKLVQIPISFLVLGFGRVWSFEQLASVPKVKFNLWLDESQLKPQVPETYKIPVQSTDVFKF